MEQKSHNRAKSQGENDFQQRLYDNRNRANCAAAHCPCNAKRDGKQHKPNGVVKGDKVINFKAKRRKGSRRLVGHRQQLTVATVKAIA